VSRCFNRQTRLNCKTQPETVLHFIDNLSSNLHHDGYSSEKTPQSQMQIYVPTAKLDWVVRPNLNRCCITLIIYLQTTHASNDEDITVTNAKLRRHHSHKCKSLVEGGAGGYMHLTHYQRLMQVLEYRHYELCHHDIGKALWDWSCTCSYNLLLLSNMLKIDYQWNATPSRVGSYNSIEFGGWNILTHPKIS